MELGDGEVGWGPWRQDLSPDAPRVRNSQEEPCVGLFAVDAAEAMAELQARCPASRHRNGSVPVVETMGGVIRRAWLVVS